jgi:hypothetical protein
MRAARVLFVVALVGMFAVAARAQVSNSDFPDPHPKFVSPDPACDPPYCTDLTYTGPTTSSPVQLFFSSVPPFPTGVPENPPAFGCTFIDDSVSEPCVTDDNGTTFFGFTLFLPGATNGQTFSLTVTGDPITLALPPIDVCVGDSIANCSDASQVTVDPTPEPTTALLFLSGIVLLSLAGFAKKRFAADSVA